MKQVHAVSLNVSCLKADASSLRYTGGLLGGILFPLSGGQGDTGELEGSAGCSHACQINPGG